MSAGLGMRRHFIPLPFTGSCLPQKRHTGGGGRGSASFISAAAALPASIAKSQRMQQISFRKREPGVTRASPPHMAQRE